MSPRALKVYGWTGHRPGCRPSHPWQTQTREIWAGPSMAALFRQTGRTRSWFFNLSETENAKEIAAALAQPGVILWRPIDDYRAEYRP